MVKLFIGQKIEEGLIMNQQVNLRKHIEVAEAWIDEIAVNLEVKQRKDWAYNALKGVLFALRDRLTHQELFHFSAQLPVLIRGIFLEGYRFTDKPEKYHVKELLNRIEDTIGPAAFFKPEEAFRAVLNLLYRHLSEGEMKDIYATMPGDIKQLWEKSRNLNSVN